MSIGPVVDERLDRVTARVRLCARACGQRSDGPDVITIVDDSPLDTRRKANRARLIQKVYEVDPLECAHCGAIMRSIALIDEPDVVERILKHLSVCDTPSEGAVPPDNGCSAIHVQIRHLLPRSDAISLDSMRMLTMLPPPLSTNAPLHDLCSTNQDPTAR